jgi:anaerobic ribonucleoside-triphosphate reductase activating protein
MTTIELSRLHYPVTALGYGVRAGIWVQGCTLGCGGCLARDTWTRMPERAVPVTEPLAWLADLPEDVDGVTISGGEPLQQPAALAALLTGIADWRAGREIDVLLYTGYAASTVRRRSDLLAHCDTVVAGRYLAAHNTGTTPLRGSANQRIIPLTALGERRYWKGAALQPGRLQAAFIDGRLWMVGIPGPGDLDRLALALAARGVDVADASWQT